MRTQPDAGQPDRLASMKNDSDVTKYVLSLSVEQADYLERIAISRVGTYAELYSGEWRHPICSGHGR